MAKALQKRLEEVLTKELKNGRAELETLPNGRICGHVISSEFRGKTYENRRLRLRRVLEKHLKPHELERISLLLTYTPKEYSFEPEEL